MSKHLNFITIVLALLLISCGGSKKEESSEYHPCYSNEALGVQPNYGDNTYQQPQETQSGPYNHLPSTMSPEEDAYEEGRALREEDRLNRTRQHEGDDYDEDYDDDYDEGYDE